MIRKTQFSYKVLFYILVIFLVISYIAVAKRNYIGEIEREQIVAHAMGEVDNISYTNSLEAFEYNYNNGIRIFEVDLVMTSDNHLVLRHYWNEKELNKNNFSKKLTLKEFNDSKILGKYTPIDLEKLLVLLETNKDVYFILDIKETDREVVKRCFEYISEKLKSENIEIVNRLIPQVLNPEMYYDAKKIIDFPLIYYGLYTTNVKEEEERIINFVEKEKIFAVSMWDYSYNDKFAKRLKDLGAKIYIHTINSKEDAIKFLEKGVDGIYTDIIKKEQLKGDVY